MSAKRSRRREGGEAGEAGVATFVHQSRVSFWNFGFWIGHCGGDNDFFTTGVALVRTGGIFLVVDWRKFHNANSDNGTRNAKGAGSIAKGTPQSGGASLALGPRSMI
jgi:hypothetical protein